jgi:glycosyltransferase involved in cell wall biosynthesis
LKILYHHRIASKDGQYIHLSAIVRELRKETHDVLLSGPAIKQASVMGGQSGWVHYLKRKFPRALYELIEFAYSLLDFFRLCRDILKFKPEVIYERANLYFVSGIWAARLFRLPILVEVNAPLFEERARHDSIALPALARWSEDYVWRHADVVLPVTEVLADIIRARVAPKDLLVIPNGIDPEDLVVRVDEAEMRARLTPTPRTFLGFVGFVRDWHKLERLIDYIDQRQDPSLCLLIVGEGPACEKLENYAAAKGLADKLILTGVVQRDLIASYINVFDVAIQPAVTEYASPLKLFEYLYMGKVIIAPDMENIREIMSDGDNGFLFDDSNRDSLFSALDHALASSDHLVAAQAKATIQRKNLLWNENARKIVGKFQQLIDHPKR